ncbi:hypothetical protein [Actinoplanes sp. L3-i22]|uniref:hypothetical protein n=1 Tax=Actinoplanes sp. L3-i22 TaxID=2836373 RepID=UPI001C775E94|nr:hypothetical protein [Actinoplanes sp. L3-i22]BCY07143.1 hypothetical protein L3i22_022310 [Actinoplanes sp. L3-i22]
MLDTRRTLLWRLAGLATGLLAAVAVATAPAARLGLGLALAAPAFALCLLAGVILGELTVRAPAGPTRTASLRVRAARTFLPRRTTRAVAGFTVLAAAFFIMTGLTADADDLGRAGRALTVTCGDVTFSETPWPGRFYSLPIAVAVLLGLAMAAVAVRTVVHRPDSTTDDRSRRAAAGAITAACGVLITAPLAGSALFAAGALSRVACAPALNPAVLVLAATAGLGACFFTARAIR